MSAPTSRKSGKTLFVWIALVVLLVVGVGFFFLLGDPYDKLDRLPAEQFLEAPIDFLGNQYMLKVQIDSQLKWDKDIGRLISVTSEMNRVRLPVFVPAGIDQNLQTGQRYEMHVRIETGGLIYVESLRKY